MTASSKHGGLETCGTRSTPGTTTSQRQPKSLLGSEYLTLHRDGTAADTPLSREWICAAVSRYGLPADTRVRFVRHGENTTYQVEPTPGCRYALRVHRPDYQTPDAIRSELAWMASLTEAGIRTPVAVPGVDGGLVQTTGVDGVTRTTVLFEWIDGVPLSAVGAIEPWEKLGELMARVHEHSRGWRDRPPWFTRPPWDAEALVGDTSRWGPFDPGGVFAPDDFATIDQCRAEVHRRLDAIGTTPDRFGLIHGDLGFENALVAENGSVTVIDFDDCGPGWFVHELAVALYPHDRTTGLVSRYEALVEGYRRERALPDSLLSELPTFLMARRLATLGWAFSRAETAHARRQRPQRIKTTPAAAREFMVWARDHRLR